MALINQQFLKDSCDLLFETTINKFAPCHELLNTLVFEHSIHNNKPYICLRDFNRIDSVVKVEYFQGTISMFTYGDSVYFINDNKLKEFTSSGVRFLRDFSGRRNLRLLYVDDSEYITVEKGTNSSKVTLYDKRNHQVLKTVNTLCYITSVVKVGNQYYRFDQHHDPDRMTWGNSLSSLFVGRLETSIPDTLLTKYFPTSLKFLKVSGGYLIYLGYKSVILYRIADVLGKSLEEVEPTMRLGNEVRLRPSKVSNNSLYFSNEYGRLERYYRYRLNSNNKLIR